MHLRCLIWFATWLCPLELLARSALLCSTNEGAREFRVKREVCKQSSSAVKGIFFSANRLIALWRLHLQITSWCPLISVLAVQACIGQVSSTSEIITDRPDITESSVVIPAGSVQVENGVTWSADHGNLTVDLSETLIRVGVLGRTEIRLTPPNYV